MLGKDFEVTFPERILAFGFDYGDLDQNAASIAFGNTSIDLTLTGDADFDVSPDDFAFFGVIADDNREIGGAFSSSFGDPAEYDNLGFVLVPEPASLTLLGLGGLIATRRRRA